MAPGSERELAVLRSPEAVASLQEGLDQVARGEAVRFEPGYFSRLAEGVEPDGD